MIKIATWNVNSLRVRLPQVIEWLTEKNIDICALQETKCEDKDFPSDAFKELGYQVYFSGQRTYNGVAIISRKPITDCQTDVPNLNDPQRRILAATINDIRVVNLYVPNGGSVESDKYQYKLDWMKHVGDFLHQQGKKHKKLLVCGDFNVAPEDIDVYDPKAWEGQVLVSIPEREALKKMIQPMLYDSFRLFEQPEASYSWWDYRTFAFRRNRGLRIDHIFISDVLKEQCTSCIIDIDPRKAERPSDHAPVVASFK